MWSINGLHETQKPTLYIYRKCIFVREYTKVYTKRYPNAHIPKNKKKNRRKVTNIYRNELYRTRVT